MALMEMRMIIGLVLTWLRRGGRTMACMTLVMLGATAMAEDQVYRSPEQFIDTAFRGAPPPARALWVQPPLREELSSSFGWRPGLRVRYWQQGGRTAWILDEIGKDKPITAGVVVADGTIEKIEVLVFRESRGWEVKYPFFTDQFNRVALADSGELSQRIDGITGATLSVRAMKRMARVALKLHEETQQTTLARSP
jgi:hypothetical protein